MTKGYDEELFAGEPYNKPYYPQFFEKFGFKTLKSYYSQRIDKPEVVHKALKPKYEKAMGFNYSIRNFNKSKFNEEIDIIYNISNVVFADNFAFTKIDRDEFVNIYTKLKPIMDPNFIFFGLDPKDTPVSFFFAFPDVSEVARAKTKFGQILRFIKYKLGLLRTNTLNMKSIGVLPDHRSKSLSSALMYAGYVEGKKRGYTHYNHCTIIEGNYSASYESGAGRKNKEYKLYQYEVKK
jgi:hypothetical protein